jgi:large subunit ribosomal protein L10
VVEEVSGRFADASAAILTEYRGLKVKEISVLRRQLTAAGGEYKIYKNTLVRRAANEGGLDSILPLLEGPTGIAFIRDDVAAVAKVLRDFARTNPHLVVKGGLLGRDLLDTARTNALADLPSRDALLAQIAGALAAPLRQMAGLLKAVPQNFAYGLSALIEQRKAAGESAEAPAAGETAAEAPVAEAAAGEGAAPAAEAAAPEAAAPEAAAPEAEPVAEAPAGESEPVAEAAGATEAEPVAEAAAATEAEPADAAAPAAETESE